MARPSMALPKANFFRKPLHAPSSTYPRTSNLVLPATFLTPHVKPHPTTRTFHSTPITNARPSPSASRRKREREWDAANAESWVRAGRPEYHVSNDGTVEFHGNKNKTAELQHLVTEEGVYIYTQGIRDGMIPKSISLKTFQRVARQLVDAFTQDTPNASAITSISSDVDAVWRIGFLVGALVQASKTPVFARWIRDSCAKAKARIPTCLIAAEQLQDNVVPKDTTWNREIAKLASHEFPPAMLLQAKILGLRGKHKEALDLLNGKIMPHLVASPSRPMPLEDITCAGRIESPFRLGALLYASLGAKLNAQGSKDAENYFLKSDEWTRKAALEFNDLDALIDYASLMMNQKNYDMYEESMSKAASGGSGKACFYIANFYFRMSLGEFPMRSQRTSSNYDPNDRATWISESAVPSDNFLVKWWQRRTAPIETSMQEYKHLAFEWYQTAFEYRNLKAIFGLALLLRDDKQHSQALLWMRGALEEGLEADPLYGSRIMEMVRRWHEPDYEPAIPKKMLPVR